jgi:hypothetical protein
MRKVTKPSGKKFRNEIKIYDKYSDFIILTIPMINTFITYCQVTFIS